MNTTALPRSVRIVRIAAVLGLALLAGGPLATRAGLIGFGPGLLACALGVLGAAIVLLATLVMLLLPALRAHRPALRRAALLALLPVAAGVAMIAPSIGKPVIHDITTDLADPPQFVAAPTRRGADANPLARDTELDAAQHAGYPDLAGIASPLAPAEALARAAAVARGLGWEVYAEDPAQGTLEASETTFWFRFTDDVAIRVRPDAGGSRVDLRSVSRVGKGDLGANARRIERFRAAFENAPPG